MRSSSWSDAERLINVASSAASACSLARACCLQAIPPATSAITSAAAVAAGAERNRRDRCRAVYAPRSVRIREDMERTRRGLTDQLDVQFRTELDALASELWAARRTTATS